MEQTTYSEMLRNPLWQKKRLEILQRDNFTCILCGDKETELHIHHEEYIRGRKPWEYENDKLKTLCKHCHFLVEYLKKLNDQIVVCRKVAYEDEYVEFYIAVLTDDLFGDKEVVVSDIYLTDNKDIQIAREYTKTEIEKISNLFKEAVL